MIDNELEKIQTTKTYSLTIWHVRAIKKLAEYYGHTDSQVLREAIEAAYAQVFSRPSELVTVEQALEAAGVAAETQP